MVRTTVTCKGQTTIPNEIRKKWNTREVLWESCSDGSARVRPLPDVLALYGSARSPMPKDPDEKAKARAAMARQR